MAQNVASNKHFFQQVLQTVGHAPERVTTDGHTSPPRAIREILGSDGVHWTNHYLNHRLEPGSSWHQTALLPNAWMRETFHLPHAFVEPSMECASSFGSVPSCAQHVTLVQQRKMFRH